MKLRRLKSRDRRDWTIVQRPPARGLFADPLLRESQSQRLDVLNGTANRSARTGRCGWPPWVRSGFPNVDTEQREAT
jgi:hypothetical protein